MRCLKAEHLCSTPMRGIRTSHVHGWVSSTVRPGGLPPISGPALKLEFGAG